MSLTSQNLLDIAEAINDSVLLATNIDFSIPSPFHFSGKEGFFNSLDDKATKLLIETTLIRACWIRYLTFEDVAGDDENAREIDGPVKELVYELTVFHEAKMTRVDETVPLDDFNKRVSLTNHEHVTAIMSLCGQFQGVNSITALAPSSFSVAETISLAQIDNSQHDVECPYVSGLIGDVTQLECRVRVQLPC